MKIFVPAIFILNRTYAVAANVSPYLLNAGEIGCNIAKI